LFTLETGGGANGHQPPTTSHAPAKPSTSPFTLWAFPPSTFRPQRHITEEGNRQFAAAADLVEHTLYTTVTEELKKQLLAAVPDRYFSIQPTRQMGYADVSCASTILAHLQTTYGVITEEDLEANCMGDCRPSRMTLNRRWKIFGSAASTTPRTM
jgi:hypothetical protein